MWICTGWDMVGGKLDKKVSGDAAGQRQPGTGGSGGMRYVGEPKGMDDHNHHGKPITEQQAIGMAILLSLSFADLRGVKLEFSDRQTSRRCGTCWWDQKRVVIYRRGLDEGTVLHEMAHLLSPKHEQHGPVFKQRFKELCIWWEKHSPSQASI